MRSLGWMLEREAEEARVVGSREVDACVALPPVEHLAARWRLRAEYSCRGGVLADTIGAFEHVPHNTDRRLPALRRNRPQIIKRRISGVLRAPLPSLAQEDR